MASDDLKFYLTHDSPRTALKGVFNTLSKETASYSECVQSLNQLASKLFGFGNSGTPWIVLAENDETMYEYVINLLEPEGPLFKMFFRNMGDVYQNTYYYPVGGLSFGMRTFTAELKDKKNSDASSLLGIYVNTPVFRYFNEKIKTMGDGKNIQVNMFEYFLFCFFYFIMTNNKMSFKTEQKIPRTSDTDNFAGFLSKLAPIRPEASRQSSKKPPTTFLFSKYLNFFFPLEKRKDYKREISNTFLFILTDFLFNQMIERAGNYSFSTEMNENATKFTYFTSVTVKHLLRLGTIADNMKSINELTLAANYRDNASSKLEPYSIVQYPAYRFLKTMFIGLKNDKIFPMKYSLSLWKALLCPWRTDQGQNTPWPFYMIANWCFYSSLFSHFMNCRFPSDVYNTSLVDLESISDLLDIFSESNTLEILKGINNMIESSELQEGALVSHMKHCGENRFTSLIFSDNLTKIVQFKIGEIQVTTSQQMSSSPRIKNLFTKGTKSLRSDFDTRIKLMKKLSSKLALIFSDLRDFDVTKTPSIYSPRSFIDTPQSVSDFYAQEELQGSAYHEEYQSMKKLTPIGIDLVVTGKHKCDKMDVCFNKKAIYRPIESNEISWLVVPLIKLSEKYAQKYGKGVDFRIFANVSNLLFILVVILFLYLIFVLITYFY
ncbi:predicted protein [Naegleria gruberi]|uniref:Predicted protein n=1 Tax=Naegleria gruberi TaxID=5762 RepID=D2VA20_NAEGR|nr:uncharacterized protein NAEGRDRAFT_65709 [Naegleria gruberi]EFC46230.1 predicted protein [Naegleria gruberi]|eukprot:XP_002678974.1 predicted protein [Naegleria gruberi strain NEG-M]